MTMSAFSTMRKRWHRSVIFQILNLPLYTVSTPITAKNTQMQTINNISKLCIPIIVISQVDTLLRRLNTITFISRLIRLHWFLRYVFSATSKVLQERSVQFESEFQRALQA